MLFEVPFCVGIFIFVIFNIEVVKFLVDPDYLKKYEKKRKERQKRIQGKKKTEGKHWRD